VLKLILNVHILYFFFYIPRISKREFDKDGLRLDKTRHELLEYDHYDGQYLLVKFVNINFHDFNIKNYILIILL